MRRRLIAVLFILEALLGGIAAGGEAQAAERVGRPIVTLPWVDYPAPAAVVPAPVIVAPGPQSAPAQAGSADAAGDGISDAINAQATNPLGPDPLGLGLGRQPAGEGELTLSQKFFRNPIVSKFIDHLDFMAFLNVLNSLRSNENLKYLPWIDLGWLVLVGIFAAWRRSRAPGMLRGMWISAYSTALFVVGSVAVIPTLLLGESYYHMWLLLGHALAASL